MNFITFSTMIALLGNQIEKWENVKILRNKIKIVLLAFFSWQAFTISSFFKELPYNTTDQILNNLHEPIVVICAIIMCIFWLALTCYTVAAAKLMKSLVG
ncbi:hypothetical protein [Moritella viscosa]|uniref:hypothetical protein n=1 Tax=Moritella viscosa TaxID=80854 RepID=UPI00094D4AF2|nr:hypothetical protein [Moritella viscosa]